LDKGIIYSLFGCFQADSPLEAIRITDAEIHFKAQNPAFLEVIVRPGYTHSVFEVLHHGERHVLIELER